MYAKKELDFTPGGIPVKALFSSARSEYHYEIVGAPSDQRLKLVASTNGLFLAIVKELE